MSNLDVIVETYVVLFSLGAYVWWRNPRWVLEVALFVISMVIMPLVYLVMFKGVILITSIFAPQFPILVFMGCCALWPLLKRDPLVTVVIALSFVVNTAGGLWTYLVLSSHPLKL
jgi:hypothetical protein